MSAGRREVGGAERAGLATATTLGAQEKYKLLATTRTGAMEEELNHSSWACHNTQPLTGPAGTPTGGVGILGPRLRRGLGSRHRCRARGGPCQRL